MKAMNLGATSELSDKATAFSIDSLLASKIDNVLPLKNSRCGIHACGCEYMLQQDEEKVQERREEINYHKYCKTCDTKPIQLELQCLSLWRRFYSLSTEMIITKNGRRMFPSLRVKVKGLDPKRKYIIAMDIVPVDNKRYRYAYHCSRWFLAGESNVNQFQNGGTYIHPESPADGASWEKRMISFDKLKLTNNPLISSGHIVLQSMRKYQPRIHIICTDNVADGFQTEAIESSLKKCMSTFAFPETQFITVTAYQNHQITRLKIDRNPFAKGFRDTNKFK